MTNTDAAGNTYQFDGWSNLGPATQQITASTDPAANRYTANYKLAGAITIQSSPEGVPMNSAAQTPHNTVAPGSAVAIYGVNLAADIATAPAGKLAKTLEHISVRVGGQVVPLFFVSPSQINVQLPSNLVDGEHTLTVHLEGKPEASETFAVARNAPGLFTTGDGKAAIAVATHQDGSLISAQSPARHGEVVTLYGTGLGPYHPAPADGVAVPSNAKYPLADPVKLMNGKQQASALWAGAASAKIGVAAVQIKIDETFPHGANASVKVHINNAESNTVVLPVQ